MPKLSEQPQQRRLHNIHETTAELDVSSDEMDLKPAIELIRALKVNSSLQSINLGNKGINAIDAQALAEALKVNPSVQRINLRHNNIGAVGAQALAEALKVNRSLRVIQLQFNNIGDAGAQALAEALKVNSRLQIILLQFNDLGDASAQALAEALKVNRSLRIIQLQINNIGAVGAQALAEALKVNRTLRDIQLQFNNIGAAGTQALAEALKVNSHLQTINLWNNNIGDAGAQALAEALKVNNRLQIIKLWDNNIGDAGAQAFAEALKVNNRLQAIELSNNNIGDAGAQALAEALKSNKGLQTIYLEYNNIGDAGIRALTEALKFTRGVTIYLDNGKTLNSPAVSYPQPKSEEQKDQASSASRLTPWNPYSTMQTLTSYAGRAISTVFSWSKPSPLKPHALELKSAGSAILADAKKEAAKPSGEITLRCESGWGGIAQQPVTLCVNSDYTMYVFPKPAVNMTPVRFGGQTAPAGSGDHYWRDSCRPVEFYGRPSVFCEGERTNVVYTPRLPTPPFAHLNSNILLGQVIWHWVLSHWQQPAQKLLPAADAADKVSGSALQARLRKLNTNLTALESQAAALPPAQQQACRWLNFSLSEHRDQLEELQTHSRISANALVALEQDVAASQEEWAEQADALSDSIINPVCPVFSPHFFPTLSPEASAASRTNIPQSPEDMRHFLTG